jgi:hypothetical protein
MGVEGGRKKAVLEKKDYVCVRGGGREERDAGLLCHGLGSNFSWWWGLLFCLTLARLPACTSVLHCHTRESGINMIATACPCGERTSLAFYLSAHVGWIGKASRGGGTPNRSTEGRREALCRVFRRG